MFPRGTSHLSEWVFPDADTLKQERLTNRKTFKQTYTFIKDDDWISLENEMSLVNYFAKQLIVVCKLKGFDFRIQNTAAMFFIRFYVNQCIMEADPRVILFTCILLAIKCEEQAKYITIKKLIEDAEGMDFEEIFRNELTVLDAISFQILILHFRTPLQYICDGFFNTYRSHLSDTDLKALELKVREVNKECEEVGVQLFSSDVHLLYTPAQIAASLFIHYGAEKLENVEKYIESLFKHQPQVWQKTQAKLAAARADIYVYQQKESVDAEKQKMAASLIKKVDKLKRKITKSLKAEQASQS